MSIEQAAASLARELGRVRRVSPMDPVHEKEAAYCALCESFPALLRSAGLVQAITYLEAKASRQEKEKLSAKITSETFFIPRTDIIHTSPSGSRTGTKLWRRLFSASAPNPHRRPAHDRPSARRSERLQRARAGLLLDKYYCERPMGDENRKDRKRKYWQTLAGLRVSNPAYQLAFAAGAPCSSRLRHRASS
jgi:hypothetical protein